MSYQGFHADDGGEFDITLTDTKSLFTPFTTACSKLENQGGLQALADALKTDLDHGIPENESHDNYKSRKKAFGVNRLPEPDPPNIFALWWDAYKDEMLIILTIAAVVSLILGIAFPPEGTSRAEGAIEGLAILAAVVIVTTVQACTNYSQEKAFQKKNAQSGDVTIKVRRGGKNTQCQIGELVVGDIVLMASGDQIPADGFITKSFNCSVNETILSGESKPVRKTPTDNYVLRGTDMQDGNCEFMVVNVGINTEWGSNFEETEFEQTPLQQKLGVIARNIGFVGLAVAAFVFVVLCIYWVVDEIQNGWNWEDLTLILQYFITAVTIVVVAVPEGLPLAVTIALAFSMQKMMKDNNFVRHLAACETMGGATQICSDKTGTLTIGRMSVVKGMISSKKFENPELYDLNDEVHSLLTKGIAINSTSYIEIAKESGEKDKYVGSATECALLLWINRLNTDYNELRENAPEPVQQFPFSSARKRMSTVIKLDDGSFRMFCKGAPEIILKRCTNILQEDGSVIPLDEATKEEHLQMIEEMASNGLRTLCMSYRDFPVFDVDADYDEEDDEPPEKKLTLICLVGIADPLREEVPNAVRTCQRAGITVRMVTGDNILTANYIARQCNILSDNGISLEGPEFARKSDAELDEILPRLQVLARSAPTDKERLVNRLKLNSELVSVTGDGANDVKALKKAHVGLAMGTGADVAKQASDIIIMDDNFTSILKSVMWGRCVFDNIRKFLQFQLTVNCAALAVAACSALFGAEPLTAVQLLWVNLIMDSFGALALATEPPTEALLEREPKNVAHKKTSLLSPEMLKMIGFQSIYQTIVLLGGLILIPYTKVGEDLSEEQVNTIIFNAFIMCQLFNLVACRKINPGEYNVFAGLHKNIVFLIILALEAVTQFVLVGFEWTFGDDTTEDSNAIEYSTEYSGNTTDSSSEPERLLPFLDWIGLIFDTVPLGWASWLFCIAVGLLGFILGLILRFVPTPKEKVYKGDLETDDGDDDDSEKQSLLVNN